MANSDPDKLMSKADKLTKLSFTRWSTDWKQATQLYEQAAVAYRFKKDNEKAKEAFEKASKGQELISSPWDAAKHMETAAQIAKELGKLNEVSDFYRRASEFYLECGRSQPASDALSKGASALEEGMPDEAIKMYTDACTILEEDGKEQMAFELYRSIAAIYVKTQRYADAATFFLRLGVAADKSNAVNSQCKAYLSAIIIYLYAHDFEQAQKCYNDCSQVDAFLNSDQNRVAMKLLAAYEDGDIEELKKVANSSPINHLDHVVIRLAKKLPTGELSTIKKGESAESANEGLDEDNLT
ncbi:hypothetical protein LUZ60_009037 [Juncus effusus]|nr:hypothetical protein LUZ60_009037 [Juncus effusus]